LARLFLLVLIKRNMLNINLINNIINMKMKLPTAESLANYVTWTGLTVKELVKADRIDAIKASKDSIIRIQKEEFDKGNYTIDIKELKKVCLAYKKLETELLGLLIKS